MEGSFMSTFFHEAVKVSDSHQIHLFGMRKHKMGFNPTAWRTIFWITTITGDDPEKDVRYSLMKGFWGHGLIRTEWFIYRGKKNEWTKSPGATLIYYCIGSIFDFDYSCWKDKKEWRQGKKGPTGGKPRATIKKNFDREAMSWVIGFDLPAKMVITVEEGEDTGLFMALSSAMDIGETSDAAYSFD